MGPELESFGSSCGKHLHSSNYVFALSQHFLSYIAYSGLLYIISDVGGLASVGKKDQLHLLLQSVLSSVGEKLLGH